MPWKLRTGFAGGLLTAAILAFCPALAHADAGIPMMPVQYPELLLFIIPVVLIEAVYVQGALGTPGRRTFVAILGVNLFTMALGYPLAWGLYQLLDKLVGFPPTATHVFSNLWWVPIWIAVRAFPAWSGLHQAVWPVIMIYVLLLLPGFLLSGLVKAWMVDGYDLLNSRGNARSVMWRANRYSYAFLTVAGSVLLYQTYMHL